MLTLFKTRTPKYLHGYRNCFVNSDWAMVYDGGVELIKV